MGRSCRVAVGVGHVDVLTLAVPQIGPSYGPACESVLYWKPSHTKQRAASLWTVVTSAKHSPAPLS